MVICGEQEQEAAVMVICGDQEHEGGSCNKNIGRTSAEGSSCHKNIGKTSAGGSCNKNIEEQEQEEAVIII
jgi:hypothetical protein